MPGIKVIFGGAGRGFNANNDISYAQSVLDTLQKVGVDTIDTAQLYGASEEVLGQLGAGDKFTIDTKSLGGFVADSLQPDALYKKAHESVEKLKTKPVDIFYIHAPDDKISPKIWVPTIDKLYKEGVFKRFGLSNFTGDQVKEVYTVAKEGGFVLPTAYQGNYSPIARKQEEVLFPTLRELKIAFYAYSPLAGGFLTKTKEDLIAGKNVGRFTTGTGMIADMYRTLYMRDSYLAALAEWAEAADNEGVSKAELAYRWVSYHSPLKAEQGDGVIFGGSSLEQIEQTANGLKKGPLKDSTVKLIEDVWEKVKHEAPLDNYNSFAKQG